MSKPITEETARTKTCVQTLAATVIAGEANFYPANCIASDCMAWRWMETPEFSMRAEAEFRQNGRRLAVTEGFCGLACKP